MMAPPPTYEQRYSLRVQEAVDEVFARLHAAYGITRDELLGPSHKPRYAWPRQLAYYVLREKYRLGVVAIGEALGRNHTTVIHGSQTVARVVAVDAAERELVDWLMAS